MAIFGWVLDIYFHFVLGVVLAKEFENESGVCLCFEMR